MKTLNTLFICLAVALTTVSCTQRSEMDRYIDNLMNKMTTEEKLGQLNLLPNWGFVSGPSSLASDLHTAKINVTK